MSGAYYNDNDPFCCAWLRNLIRAGLIAPGEVDSRDIKEVIPDDLKGFTQCHFFAGIGGWSYALRLAGWEDDRPVWTGSCPCQPWSVANVAHGGAKGRADERHLLPYFIYLIGECRPVTVFGEQVAHSISKGWLDDLTLGLGGKDYTCGSCVLRASAYGADHERRRLLWVAHSSSQRRERYKSVKRFPQPAATSLALPSHEFLGARRVMAGNYQSVPACDGTSVVVERNALGAIGNTIVPQVAQAFIQAYMSIGDGQ